MGLRVIGAGFGRTGTYSLKSALETLGFGPCFHMSEVFANPDRASMISAAFRDEPMDWDAVFEGYNSTVDWPTCTFYEQLARRYPESRVVLTIRDPDRWHRSCMDTIAWRGDEAHANQEPGDDPIEQMIDTVIWRGTFDRRFDDRDHAVGIFEAHNREVTERIPANRLLVFDVKEGWGPLCEFLEVPKPEEAFPHLNDTEQFRREFLGVNASGEKITP